MSVEPNSVIELTRKQLYDEIWTISAAGVARKYGVPYTQFLAQVKAADIAIPSSTYWAMLGTGKAVEKTEFSGDADKVVPISREPVNLREKKRLQSMNSQAKDAHQAETKKSTHVADKTKTIPSVNNEKVDRIKPVVSITHQERKEPETYQQYGVTYNVYDRGTLYSEVWEEPVTEVAKRYQVTDVAIHKVCKSLDIPTPPLGYWAKLRAGKSVTRMPLPEANEPSKKSGIRMGIEHKPEIEEETLAFMSEEEKAKIFSVAMQIMLPDENQKMHPSIIAHHKEITEWIKQREAREEAERKRQEEERLREKRQKRYEREVALTCALVNEAEDYTIACKIRAYVVAVEAAGELNDEGIRWVEWARKKADWYDPTVAREDDCLGQREHEKDANDKQLRRTHLPWSGWR